MLSGIKGIKVFRRFELGYFDQLGELNDYKDVRIEAHRGVGLLYTHRAKASATKISSKAQSFQLNGGSRP